MKIIGSRAMSLRAPNTSTPWAWLLFLSSSVFAQLHAAELETSIGLKNKAFYRGFNLSNDSSPVVQLLADLRLENGIYAGVWASTVDFDDDRQFEFDYFVGYQRRISTNLAFDVTLQRYTFDEDAARGDYNWTELQLTAHLGQRSSIMYTRGHDWIGSDRRSAVVEAIYRHPFPARLTGFVSVGRHIADKVLPQNFNYYETGLIRTVGKFELKLQFAHSQSNDLATVHNEWSIGIERTFFLSP